MLSGSEKKDIKEQWVVFGVEGEPHLPFVLTNLSSDYALLASIAYFPAESTR